jgi:hypothetical protein
VYSHTYTGLGADPTVTLQFDPAPSLVKKIRIEVKNVNAGDEAKLHIREIAFSQ